MAEPTTDTANDSIESRKDVDDKPQSSKFWIGEIQAAHKRNSKWAERGEKVIARYRDERNQDRGEGAERRTNILWSNTETLKSALFQGLGKPDVRRRFQKRGQDDRISRQTALVLERGLAYCSDAYDAESEIDACVEDELLPGRGTAWVVYEADIDDGPAETEANDSELDEPPEAPDVPGQEEPDEQNMMEPQGPSIKSQRVFFEHVYWRDFLTSAGRKWSDVWWCARGHDYSRDELKRYFPEHANDIPLNVEIAGYEESSRKKSRKEDEDTFKRARVWQIWDKSKKQRVYVAEGYKFVLKADEDPYKLQHFFPTVEPLYGVKTTSSLDPIPEYTLYQDQAEELDTIQTRLTKLTAALKRRGVYDASLEGPDNQLSGLAFAGDNEFLPYRNFAVLNEKGGLKAAFQSEDLKPLVEVIDRLGTRQVGLVQQIYEITGISDIMRGATNANETATAQRGKMQFGTMRLQKRQKKVQLFIRSLYRLKAEIMAEHFTREMLQEMTGIDMPTKQEQDQIKMALAAFEQQQKQAAMAAQQAQQMAKQGNGAVAVPPPAPPQIDPMLLKRMVETSKAVTWEEISSILRSDQRRGYKVDIDTDSLAKADDETEKSARMEFMTAMQAFMEKTVPAVMQFPALAPLAKETASFAVGAFKVGRTMEESFDDTFQQLEDQAKAQMAKGPQPSPEEKKVQLEQQARQAELQFKAKEAETDRQLKQQELQHSAQLKEKEFAHQAMLDQRKMENEAILAQRKMDQEQQLKAAEFDHQRTLAEFQAQHQQQQADREAQFKQAHAATEFNLRERELGQQKELGDRQMEFEREKHGATHQFEREKHTGSMNFEREKHVREMASRLSVNHEEKAGKAAASAQSDGLTKEITEAIKALRDIAAQQATALRQSMAPKRLVKDPKTGEKRVEIVPETK